MPSVHLAIFSQVCFLPPLRRKSRKSQSEPPFTSFKRYSSRISDARYCSAFTTPSGIKPSHPAAHSFNNCVSFSCSKTKSILTLFSKPNGDSFVVGQFPVEVPLFNMNCIVAEELLRNSDMVNAVRLFPRQQLHAFLGKGLQQGIPASPGGPAPARKKAVKVTADAQPVPVSGQPLKIRKLSFQILREYRCHIVSTDDCPIHQQITALRFQFNAEGCILICGGIPPDTGVIGENRHTMLCGRISDGAEPGTFDIRRGRCVKGVFIPWANPVIRFCQYEDVRLHLFTGKLYFGGAVRHPLNIPGCNFHGQSAPPLGFAAHIMAQWILLAIKTRCTTDN